MKRKTFSEILKSASISLDLEYKRLFEMFYEEKLFALYYASPRYTFEQIVNNFFVNFPIRGTARSLADFNKEYGFNFEKFPRSFDIDYLVLFCEYFYNLASALSTYIEHLYHEDYNENLQCINQIIMVIEKIGYQTLFLDGIMNFVPVNAPAIMVAEKLPETLSYKTIYYNHHSLKGDLEEKKLILKSLGDYLEPKRAALKAINKSIEDSIFFVLNSAGIRHNNFDPNDTKHYNEKFAKLSQAELENAYDDLYGLILIACLDLEYQKAQQAINLFKK